MSEDSEQIITVIHNIERYSKHDLNLDLFKSAISFVLDIDRNNSQKIIIHLKNSSGTESSVNVNQRQTFESNLNLVLQEKHCNPKLRVGEIAKELGMSERNFFRVILKTKGVTPTKYLRQFRLRLATKKIKNGGKMTNICHEVGFASYSYFVKSFKTEFGLSPSKLINSIQ